MIIVLAKWSRDIFRSRCHFQGIQVPFLSDVLDAQKLVAASKHVNVIMFTFCTFSVKELVAGITIRRIFKNAVHDLKESFSQCWRATFRDVSAGGLKGTRLKRRCIYSNESHEDTLVGKADAHPQFQQSVEALRLLHHHSWREQQGTPARMRPTVASAYTNRTVR